MRAACSNTLASTAPEAARAMDTRRFSILLDPRVPSEARAIEAYEKICAGLPRRAQTTLLREILVEGLLAAAGMQPRSRRGRPPGPAPAERVAIRVEDDAPQARQAALAPAPRIEGERRPAQVVKFQPAAAPDRPRARKPVPPVDVATPIDTAPTAASAPAPADRDEPDDHGDDAPRGMMW